MRTFLSFKKKTVGFLVPLLVVLLRGLAFGLSLEERVKEYRLPNGMEVLLVERHYAPVVSFIICFKVGAVDEFGGETGTAHFIEHMLFKGTKTLGTRNYKKEKMILEKIDWVMEQIEKEMEKADGADKQKIAKWKEELEALQKEHRKWLVEDEISELYTLNGAEGLNASTGYDLTTYQVNLPANRVELWARIESDRMVNPVWRDFYSEREVVREERRQREESDPDGKLIENFLATAFLAHPYGKPVIGWDSDLKRLNKARVDRFFRNYYGPNNAVVAVVGDIVPEEVMKIIGNYFGKIPPQEINPRLISEEPEQSGERRVEVVMEANPKVIIGYHKPTLPHFDDYVFDVIDMILSKGRTSRLYKVMVEQKNLAVEISTANGVPGARYPNLFVLSATPRSPHTCEELEEEIYTQLDKLKTEGVGAVELDKVKNQLEAEFIRSLASNEGLAGRLSYYQAVAGNWRYAEEHLKVIEKITAEDVRKVAGKYFVKENRTVATLVNRKRGNE